MNEPLSKSQTELQGQNLGDMSVEQLFDWLDACSKMERWVKPQKARRTWHQGRIETLRELSRRGALADAVTEDT